jgi:5'-3' exonuclease
MKTALIDADSIIHIVAPRYEISATEMLFIKELPEEDQKTAIHEAYMTMDSKVVTDHIGSFINSILNAVNATHYLGFLGDRNGSNTFRHKLAVTKPYKGKRPSSPSYIKYWKPIMVDYMVKTWGFIELSNIEADDACTICATHLPDCIICSPDKDLRQKPGEFYDYKKTIFETVDEIEALRRLYVSVLVGDSTDNIGGCKGVGKESKLLEFQGCTTHEDFYNYALDVYKSKKQEGIFNEQLALIFMLRVVDGIDLREIPTPIKRLDFGIRSELPVQDEEIILPVFTFNQ